MQFTIIYPKQNEMCLCWSVVISMLIVLAFYQHIVQLIIRHCNDLIVIITG